MTVRVFTYPSSCLTGKFYESEVNTMKIDIKKIKRITNEMSVNDLMYKMMRREYELIEQDIDEGNYKDITPIMKKAYFYKRVLSILENKDVPIRAAIGLIDTITVLDGLYEDRFEFIGDSDTDEDIYSYVIEYGFRMYDQIAHWAEVPEDVFIRLMQTLAEESNGEVEQ